MDTSASSGTRFFCDAKSCSTVLSTFLQFVSCLQPLYSYTQTLHSSQRGPYVCVLHTCDHWRVVWAVSCMVQGRPVSWQQPPPVHPGKAGGMRGRDRVNDDGLWLLIYLEIWREKLLELLNRLRCRIAIQICCKTAENGWVDSGKTLKSREG